MHEQRRVECADASAGQWPTYAADVWPSTGAQRRAPVRKVERPRGLRLGDQGAALLAGAWARGLVFLSRMATCLLSCVWEKVQHADDGGACARLA